MIVKDNLIEIRQKLVDQFSHFERSDFIPYEDIKSAYIAYLAWALPAFIFVLWSNIWFPDIGYYNEAIRQGIGLAFGM